MTWHTPNGQRTLRGAEAELIRDALGFVADMIAADMDGGPPWEFDVPLFDRLESPVKLALLLEVGTALLCDTDSCPPLTAINEATIGVLFRGIEMAIEIECDCQEDPAQDEPNSRRHRVLAALRETDEADDLPSPHCTDLDEWEFLASTLANRVLWDEDYHASELFLDAAPETSQRIKDRLGVDDDYYRAIPPDATEADAPRLRAAIAKLHGR